MKQGIHEQSVDQIYPIGKRLAVDDRVFRYGYAATALRPLMDGMNGNLVSIRGNTDAIEYPAGTRQITIPMNPNSDDYVDEQKADYWKGALTWIQASPWAPTVTGIGQQFRIKSNAVAVGGFVTLTLEDPLTVTVPASTHIEAWPNIYKKIVGVPSPFVTYARQSLVCLPLILVTLGNYFWGQTWGPMFCQCGAAPGLKEHDRDMYWKADHYGLVMGSQVDFSALGNAIPQRVGFVLADTHPWTDMDGVDKDGGDNLIMLQLSP